MSCARSGALFGQAHRRHPHTRYNTNARLLTVARVRFEFFPNAHLQTSFKFFSFRILVYSSRTDKVLLQPLCAARGAVFAKAGKLTAARAHASAGSHGVRDRVLRLLGIPRTERGTASVPPRSSTRPVRTRLRCRALFITAST